MATPKYLDFEDYAKNDPKFLLRALKDELHNTQSKIKFLDGTTYHVTKAGNRYWEYFDLDNKQLGFKGELRDGRRYWYCSLDQQTYNNAGDFWQRIHFLTE